MEWGGVGWGGVGESGVGGTFEERVEKSRLVLHAFDQFQVCRLLDF